MTDDEIRRVMLAVAWSVAMREYDMTGDTSAIDRQLERGNPVPQHIRSRLLKGLKRKRGGQPKLRISPEHVVVMVARAARDGHPNSNSDIYPSNPAFTRVAACLGVSVATIAAQYRSVPDERRSQIKAELFENMDDIESAIQ